MVVCTAQRDQYQPMIVQKIPDSRGRKPLLRSCTRSGMICPDLQQPDMVACSTFPDQLIKARCGTGYLCILLVFRPQMLLVRGLVTDAVIAVLAR
jgi:hypothetical protein